MELIPSDTHSVFLIHTLEGVKPVVSGGPKEAHKVSIKGYGLPVAEAVQVGFVDCISPRKYPSLKSKIECFQNFTLRNWRNNASSVLFHQKQAGKCDVHVSRTE